jgi:hypothetical protein
MNPGMMHNPFYVPPPMFSGPMGGQMFQQAMQGQKPVIDIEEVKETSQQDKVNEEVVQTSNSMIEILSKSDNPKHRNSKFLRFLKKLGQGAYTIENEQLVKQPEKLAEFRKAEEARLQEEKLRP